MTRVQWALPWRCLLVAVLAGGCAPTVEYQYIGTEFVRNSQGHVVGHKETLLDATTGEEIEVETLYRPVRDPITGEIVAYEEPVHVVADAAGTHLEAAVPEPADVNEAPDRDELPPA